jgi:hypothetical protein
MAEEKTTEEQRDDSGEREVPAQPDPLQQLGDPAHSAEAELFPSGEAGAPGEKAEDDPGDAVPFASAEAPWVGAEQKWLNGEERAPGEKAPEPEDPAKSFPMFEGDTGELLMGTQQIPVLPSIIPPAAPGVGLGFKIGIAAVLLVVVAAAGGVVYWMNARFSEREQQIMELRHADQQDVMRLERQIRELLAQGGAENEARANALQVELNAARGGSPEADRDRDTDDSDPERRHRQRNDTDGAGELDPTAVGTAAASPRGSKGGLDDNPYGKDEPFQYLKDPVDDLLDNAIAKPNPASTEAAAPAQQGAADFPVGGAELPQSPSRDQVKAAMDAIAPQVRKCGGEPGGRVVVSFAVSGATGRVVSAEPAGDASGTPLGLCAARAVKLAKFPHFKQDRLPIKYPFDL